MMAMWKAKVQYQDGAGTEDYLYFSSADATSMTKRALAKARVNASKRAKARFAKRGIKVVVQNLSCVG